ncbi:sarcosine oxidase subunit delta [Aureimonas leprariae]|uniref:Sarcosine oxidase subunit delta n=1 Tax=Plantimonas leprariae TaxID=2615207 RepID=A0A7V7TYG0_9HYPH|nr:sarcosine oxidase subunit delta [Aureimonas leprariae]KAB0682726.1 sarcosine oxidase subunit delta [Aureimonas leprariae]
MRIDCPYCGSRDLREFSFLGDAETAGSGLADATPEAAVADPAREATRVYFRLNPAGRHVGLWYHEGGCRSWLRVERDTRTHEVFSVAFAGERAR